MKKIFPPNHFLIYLIIAVLFHFVLPIEQIIVFPINLIGSLLIIVGVFLNLYADKIFKNLKTTVKPDQKPTALIDYGPFRISRNPMYLGMALILIGAGIILGSITSFVGSAFFVFAMEVYFIPDEEKSLKDAFGENFEKYKNKVRRWI
jgi:protein-S-isoprenylcysteine O-methyltransferase Ste14